MKQEPYTSLICKKFCSYYSWGKESELCGGYFYLKKFLTPSELSSIIEVFHLDLKETLNQELSFICSMCDFREEGCDFFINKSNLPCGGYLIINRMISRLNKLRSQL